MSGSWSTSSSGIEDGAKSSDLVMKTQQQADIWNKSLLLSCILLVNCSTAEAQRKRNTHVMRCSPKALATRRTPAVRPRRNARSISREGSYSANVTPGIPKAKSNQLFCIKAGTTVVWMSSNKNNGFMVSFGSDSPFDPDGPIMGGGKKQVTTKASTPGCYKYDAGAFRSGTVYGMSSGSKQELVILP